MCVRRTDIKLSISVIKTTEIQYLGFVSGVDRSCPFHFAVLQGIVCDVRDELLSSQRNQPDSANEQITDQDLKLQYPTILILLCDILEFLVTF